MVSRVLNFLEQVLEVMNRLLTHIFRIFDQVPESFFYLKLEFRDFLVTNEAWKKLGITISKLATSQSSISGEGTTLHHQAKLVAVRLGAFLYQLTGLCG